MSHRTALLALSTGIIFAVFTTTAHSEMIDVEKLIVERLMKRGLPYDPQNGQFGLEVVGWRVTNIRAIGKSIRYSEVKRAALPDSITTERYVIRNCTAAEKKQKETLEVSYVAGATVSVTRGVQLEGTTTGEISLERIGGKVGTNTSTQTTFSKQDTQNYTETRTEKRERDVDVPARSILFITMEKRVQHDYLAFEGDIIVDSETFSVRNRGGYHHPNGPLRHHLNEQERTFTVKGEIWNADGKEVTITFDEAPLPPDSPHCLNGALASVSPLFSTRDIALLALKANETSAVLEAALASSTKKTMPLVSGMSIKTGNVVANVDVRGKSHGPGFCAVEVSGGGKKIMLATPPFSWSSWTTLFSHLNSVNATLSFDAKCDTGALLEVRFFQ